MAAKRKHEVEFQQTMDSRLNLFRDHTRYSDYKQSFYKSFRPTNVGGNMKVFKLRDTEAFMNTADATLQIKGRLLMMNADKSGLKVPKTRVMEKIAESSAFMQVPEGTKVEYGDAERIKLVRTSVLKVVEYVDGIALTPINYLSAGLFKDVSLKMNNFQVPISSRQLYYYQSLIRLMLTVNKGVARKKFRGGSKFRLL